MAYPKCGAKTRTTGKPCKKPQGWGTQHVGFGKCRLHGGATPIKHGRYSLVHRQSLQAKVSEFLADPAPGDLSSELALTRALLQDYLNRFGEDVALPMTSIKHINDMVEQIGKTVERISRILNQTALTQAEVQVLQVTIADLLLRYMDDPDQRIAFLGELRKALAGTGFDRTPDRPSLTG